MLTPGFYQHRDNASRAIRVDRVVAPVLLFGVTLVKGRALTRSPVGWRVGEPIIEKADLSAWVPMDPPR